MDPFAVIGLASNIVSFLDFGFKLVSTAKSIRASSSGASVDNDDLSFRTQQLQRLVLNLRGPQPFDSLSVEERSLLQVAAQCVGVSADLEKLLDKLKARNPKSKRQAFRAALHNWWREDEKEALEQKLGSCRQQLNVQLLSLMRSESLVRFQQLIEDGKVNRDNLQSLAEHIESLRRGINVSYLEPKALDQIRSLLNLTEDAVLKVRQARVLDGLRFELMNERFENIVEAHERTFDWIFQNSNEDDLDVPKSLWKIMAKARDSFVTWLEQGSGIFHISGKPGSGKSTLMKYLSQHPRTRDHLRVWASGKKPVLGKFFFWKPGSDLQKSIKGLVRGLLHCLLSECPDLISLVFPVQWDASMHRERVHIEHHECISAFEKLIGASPDYSDHKFVLFIDGLDEFEGNHVDLTRQLCKWTEATGNVKLCISSREWQVFKDAFRNCPQLRLHDITRADIQHFVRDRFHEMRIDTLINDNLKHFGAFKIGQLQSMIVRESDGVFLWVTLVLRHVEEGLINGDRLEDLMRLIRSLPTELEPMLRELLGSIPPNNRELAYAMLSFVEFCSKVDNQVYLMQYSFLEEYLQDKNFARDPAVLLRTTKDNAERLKRAERRLYGICKGFFELRLPNYHGRSHDSSKFVNILGNAVHLTHRSIVEFLQSQYFEQNMKLELPDFDGFDAYCQTYLGQLKSVHLPKTYLSVKYRGAKFFGNDVFAYPLHPSFIEDMERIILLNQHRATPRFLKFLDDVHSTLIDLGKYIDHKCALRIWRNEFFYCDAESLIMIACARVGFYEYLLHRQDTGSEVTALCASVCMLTCIHSSDDELYRRFKTLHFLFDNGASPNCMITQRDGGILTTFHQVIWFCCCNGFGNRAKLFLSVIAFMLYNGVNPRFAFNISSMRYRLKSGFIFKMHYTSERPLPESEYGVETIRHPADNFDVCYSIKADKETLDMIKKHGWVIDLRTLASIWYPGQSDVLQQVIDWILELGVLTDAQHRSELQNRFGHLLRPFFDRDCPDFIGWVSARDVWPRGYISGTYSRDQFQLMEESASDTSVS